MIFHLFPISFLSCILIFARLSTCTLSETELYENCSKPFQCGNIQNISYPFLGGGRSKYCGHPDFSLDCENKNYPQIEIQSNKYQVLSIDYTTYSLTLVQSEFWESICPSTPLNATINASYMKYSSNSENITLYYGCPLYSTSSFPNQFNCGIEGSNTVGYYQTSYSISSLFDLNFAGCSSSVLVQVQHDSVEALSSNSMNISLALKSGFEVDWDVNNSDCDKCVQFGGVCGSDPNSDSDSFSFICFCADKTYDVSCGDNGKGIHENGMCPSDFVISVLATSYTAYNFNFCLVAKVSF